MPLPPIAVSALEYLLAHPEPTVAIIAGLLGTGRFYQKTGRIPLGRLPWRALRQIARDLGDQYFGTSRPRGVPGLVVEAAPKAVERSLRDRHYESVDLYSYEYDGELGNLRRPSGTRPHPTTGEPVPMETHPRLFETTDGRTLLICHDEASRFEATGLHLDESLLSWERGRDDVSEDLDAVELPYDAIPSERQAGIEIVS